MTTKFEVFIQLTLSASVYKLLRGYLKTTITFDSRLTVKWASYYKYASRDESESLETHLIVIIYKFLYRNTQLSSLVLDNLYISRSICVTFLKFTHHD